MKKVSIALIALFTIAISSCNKQKTTTTTTETINIVESEQTQAKPKLYIKQTFNLHKPSRGCERGMGLCEGHLDICGWQVFKTTANGDVFANVSLGIDIENTTPTLKVIFENSLPFPNDNAFEIANNVDITGESLEQLNYNHINLIAGNYMGIINTEGKYEYSIPVNVD